MLNSSDPTIRALLEQGCKVSVQVHLAPGRPARYTAIARLPDGHRAQGWGGDAQDALSDLGRRLPLSSEVASRKEASR